MADEKRLNPLADVLANELEELRQEKGPAEYNSDFPSADKVKAVGEKVGFVSRDSVAAKQDEAQGVVEVRKPYRWTTGRNRTTTIRASDETINLFDKVATKLKLQKGVVLERALAAFIRETGVDVDD
jgi:hypothetical protein